MGTVNYVTQEDVDTPEVGPGGYAGGDARLSRCQVRALPCIINHQRLCAYRT